MEKLNYFTDELSAFELLDFFESLEENELYLALRSLIAQYMILSEDLQLKYAKHFLVICRDFQTRISLSEQYNILKTLEKILKEAQYEVDKFVVFKFLMFLYYYLTKVEKYEEYSIFFNTGSLFFDIVNKVVKEGYYNSLFKDIYSGILVVFCKVFQLNSLSHKKRLQLKSKLENFVDFLFESYEFENNDFENIIFWYFELDELLSIFKIEHLETISNYYINNPQSDDVGKYLDFVSRHFDDIIEDSIEVIRKIVKENDSDIIRDQAIKLVKMYDESDSSDKGIILKKERDSNFILSENYKELLDQAEAIIDDIRSNLTVAAKDLKTIGSFGHYTKIDTLTNFLIKADWKNENNSETQPPFLRLTNLKQLNDPMEGRAIHDYLGIDNTFFQQYQTSNVFISSLTTVSDSLPMWKEYADSCQGAFLEYDMSYLEHIVAHQSIEFVKIHYLDLNSGAKDESDVGKALDNLKQIFEKMQEFEGETPLIDLAEKLKKISYLFKVKDYGYEMEYRILINLDDTSVKTLIEKHNKSLDKNKDLLKGKDLLNENYLKKEEIGLEVFDKVNYNDFRKYIVLSPKDNGRYDLFVYINLAPLKYSKVILGPKVTDADYIAPYLKLANPDIEIESSKIPYR